jgi:hypothetical protein
VLVNIEDPACLCRGRLKERRSSECRKTLDEVAAFQLFHDFSV